MNFLPTCQIHTLYKKVKNYPIKNTPTTANKHMLNSSPKIYHVCQEALHGQVRTPRPMFRTHLTGDLPPPPPVAFIN